MKPKKKKIISVRVSDEMLDKKTKIGTTWLSLIKLGLDRIEQIKNNTDDFKNVNDRITKLEARMDSLRIDVYDLKDAYKKFATS